MNDPTPSDFPPPAVNSDSPSLQFEGAPPSTWRIAGTLLGLIVSGAVLAFIPDLILPVKVLLIGFLGMSATKIFQSWRYPVRLELSDGELRWRVLGKWTRGPAAAVTGLQLMGGQLVVQWEAEPDPPAAGGAGEGASHSESTLPEQIPAGSPPGRTRYQTILPSGAFTLWEVNQVRQALGFEPQRQDDRGQKLASFVQRIRGATPRLWVTPTIVAINALLFAYLWWIDIPKPRPGATWLASGLSRDLLLAWGANYGPLTLAGEWWRLIACTFLHWNVVHIGFNMWALVIVGRIVERLLGNVAYLTTYLFAGICGSLASVWWHPISPSVGASGAVFGIFGAMLGLVLRQRNAFPAEVTREIRSLSLNFLIANLLLGSQIKGIDTAAHVGGCLGGLLCGLAIAPKVGADGRRRPVWQLAAFIAGCLVLAVGGVASLPPPRFDVAATILQVSQADSEAYQAFADAEKELSRPGTNVDAWKKAVERNVLRPWREETQRIAEAEHVAPEDAHAKQLLDEFMQLRLESWELLTQGLAESDTSRQVQGMRRLKDAARKLQELVDADGPRLGIDMTRPEERIPTDGA